MGKKSPPFNVSIERNGKSYRGSAYTEDGMVIVQYGDYEKCTQIGADSEMTARMLLQELVAIPVRP